MSSIDKSFELLQNKNLWSYILVFAENFNYYDPKIV
jgi:hypothetical protein